ncbi:MAG: hypothetical protein ABI478_00620, partial [Propionivibrio sp.]
MLRSIGLAGVMRRLPSVRAVFLLSLLMTVAILTTATAVLVDFRHRQLAHSRGEILSLTRILSDQ